METLFKNQFVEVNIDKEKKYAEMVFFPESVDMEEDDYKEIVIKANESVATFLENKVDKYLYNYVDFNYILSPEIQEWYAKNSKIVYMNNSKIASVMSEDFVANLSIEQIIQEYDDKKGLKFTRKYSDNLQEAKKWLFE